MIAWAKSKWEKAHGHKTIPLRLPNDMLLFTNSDRERIDALIDEENRVRRMVVIPIGFALSAASSLRSRQPA